MYKLITFCLIVLVCTLHDPVVYCHELTINYSPASLRFGSAESLYVSDFDDVLASALGYTPRKSISWSGLTVTSPFNYPSSILCFVVRDAGISVRMEGITYDLKEDVPIIQSYETFTTLVGARTLRDVHFSNVNAIDLVPKFNEVGPLPRTKELKEKDPMVHLFLQQMAALVSIVDYLDTRSSKGVGGQDIIFIEVDSFAPLVKQFGANSAQVKEASVILRSSLSEAIDRLREFYSDRVVVATVKLARARSLARAKRQITSLTNKTEVFHNLAHEYSDDFPVIFNIVLFLSIVLVVAIVATSASMAFMDPGRDSIIYRMTNPRMKKDQ